MYTAHPFVVVVTAKAQSQWKTLGRPNAYSIRLVRSSGLLIFWNIATQLIWILHLILKRPHKSTPNPEDSSYRDPSSPCNYKSGLFHFIGPPIPFRSLGGNIHVVCREGNTQTPRVYSAHTGSPQPQCQPLGARSCNAPCRIPFPLPGPRTPCLPYWEAS